MQGPRHYHANSKATAIMRQMPWLNKRGDLSDTSGSLTLTRSSVEVIEILISDYEGHCAGFKRVLYSLIAVLISWKSSAKLHLPPRMIKFPDLLIATSYHGFRHRKVTYGSTDQR